MRILFILFLLLYTGVVTAQYKINGTITNTSSEAISFGTIQIINNKKLQSYTITDTNGNYSLELKEAGIYTIKVTHIGYITIEESLAVSAESNSIIKNYTLTKDTQPLDEIVLKFDPKVMRINTDTITYNLKKLTDGTENSLADVLDKLPGVQLNPSGQITVNGKAIKKLLIDGEELFKKQHRITAESITSEMIEGIRYLDKFKDFGNIRGFDNKQMRALDISIKDKFKNKITGDLKIQAGYDKKALLHSNLYRLGGKLKIGFIGDWNNLGKQSITSYEYKQLINTRDEEDFNTNSLTQKEDNETPRFFDPIIDVSQRENTFGAISFIYKPLDNFKISLLNLSSNTLQKQRFFIQRNFFENQNVQQQEARDIDSDFFINTSIIEMGYQPSDRSFFNYTLNYSPKNISEKYLINTTTQNANTEVSQKYNNDGFKLEQQISFISKITNKTILKWSGLAEIQESNKDVNIKANQPFLGISLGDDFAISQLQDQNTKLFGYELQTTSKFKKSKLGFYQGILFSKDNFKNHIIDNQPPIASIKTDRTDSYIGFIYRGRISRKLKYKTDLSYRYLFFKRFDKVFDEYLFLPKISIDYTINAAKRLDVGYSYDITLPTSKSINQSTMVQNYFTLLSSIIPQDEVFPSHTLSASFSNFKTNTGSNLFIFSNYNYAPEFLSINSFLDTENVVNMQNIVGKDRHRLILGVNTDNRFRKLKLNLFINTSWLYNQKENQINLQENIAKTTRFKQKIGAYSRFRKGINYNVGIDYEITSYRTTINSIKNKASVTKPYLYLTGTLFNKKILWSFGGEYAMYKTDRTKTQIFDIKPNITYTLNDSWKFMLEGNNILNVDTSEITENFNTTNYTESSISNTLQGYLIIGAYYRLK
ncbi:carboxypeptidase-like regulatory domain-containing protein [Aquimarina sp. I32.4]|uniref:carboxypeptidase-like regulatory domain-containing protein n=1 Tax=Aquimarina sp. I32.4 TaxID=2053903 RepID=UPI000CDF002F|nr:carboxypeptidase-like regulatory domain-containing protein [Aquimarina sp. I32.4]